VLGIVRSVPFQMKEQSPAAAATTAMVAAK
jgi:hypothetical protein